LGGKRTKKGIKKMNGTPIGSLGVEDFKKIGKGFLIAIIGAGALAGADEIITLSDQIDFGVWEAISVSIATTLVNAIRKWVTDTRG
jgi:hypothetical protein